MLFPIQLSDCDVGQSQSSEFRIVRRSSRSNRRFLNRADPTAEGTHDFRPHRFRGLPQEIRRFRENVRRAHEVGLRPVRSYAVCSCRDAISHLHDFSIFRLNYNLLVTAKLLLSRHRCEWRNIPRSGKPIVMNHMSSLRLTSSNRRHEHLHC